MEFDKNKVYGPINVDKNLVGCKGYFAYTLESLKKLITENKR